MQILTGGSFVKLENKERIENLIFTARAMANAAIETDGFLNEPENNRRLALEIWQGAEYMTLDHEEAQVKNLFVNNFLDRLRETNVAEVSAETVSDNAVGEVCAPSSAASEIEPRKDEFLGLISTEEIEDKSVAEPDDSIEARTSQNAETAVSAQNDSVAGVKTGAAEIVEAPTESNPAIPSAANQEIEIAEPESEPVIVTTETSESAPSGDKQTENSQASAKVPGAIVLPEKEPYRWEKCTVTATIQLLPTADDSDAGAANRKVVLSIRTHDFAPQFSVVELSGDGDSILSELLPALRESLEKYKTDLPLKVMDKMKREKSAAKKQSNKTTVTANNSAAGSQPKPEKKPAEKVAAKAEDAKPASAAASNAAPKSSVVIPAQSGQQGSLFGF